MTRPTRLRTLCIIAALLSTHALMIDSHSLKTQLLHDVWYYQQLLVMSSYYLIQVLLLEKLIGTITISFRLKPNLESWKMHSCTRVIVVVMMVVKCNDNMYYYYGVVVVFTGCGGSLFIASASCDAENDIAIWRVCGLHSIGIMYIEIHYFAFSDRMCDHYVIIGCDNSNFFRNSSSILIPTFWP